MMFRLSAGIHRPIMSGMKFDHCLPGKFEESTGRAHPGSRPKPRKEVAGLKKEWKIWRRPPAGIEGGLVRAGGCRCEGYAKQVPTSTRESLFSCEFKRLFLIGVNYETQFPWFYPR